MSRASLVRLSLCAVLVLTVGVGLISFPQPVVAANDTVTTELQPGLNLAGWTEPAASIEAIFDDIPSLDLVYAWDAENQWFRWAARTDTGVLGDLRTLTPGMGLWLSITGREPVTWRRPIVTQAADASLGEGWNLVVWGGEDNMASEGALKDLEHILRNALDVDGRRPLKLARGDAYWFDVAVSREWDQLYRYPAFEFVSDYSPEKQREVRQSVDELVEFFYQRLGVRASGLTLRYGDRTVGPCGEYRSATHTIFIRDDGCFVRWLMSTSTPCRVNWPATLPSYPAGSSKGPRTTGPMSTVMRSSLKITFEYSGGWPAGWSALRSSLLTPPTMLPTLPPTP